MTFRCGFACALALAACSEAEPPAPPTPPRGAPTTTSTAPPPPTATTTTTTAPPNSGESPVALALNDVEACASVVSQGGKAVDRCWELGRPDLAAPLGLGVVEMVGRGRWFLGRTTSRTYAWGARPALTGDDGGPSTSLRLGAVEAAYAADRAAAGPRHGCVIDRNDDLYCWGDDSACQTSAGQSCGGTRDTTNLSAILGPGVRFTGVAAGTAHTCAVASTGTGATANVYCWGANTSGETGQPVSGRAAPEPLPLVPPVKSNELAVAAGDHHGCAIVRGDLYCWGKNDQGQAAPDSDAAVVPPAKVDLSAVVGKVSRLALGGDRTCFVLSPLAGSLPPRAFCLRGRRVVEIPGLEGVTHLAVSTTHTCAIARATGSAALPGVYCWPGDERPRLVTLPRVR